MVKRSRRAFIGYAATAVVAGVVGSAAGYSFVPRQAEENVPTAPTPHGSGSYPVEPGVYTDFLFTLRHVDCVVQPVPAGGATLSSGFKVPDGVTFAMEMVSDEVTNVSKSEGSLSLAGKMNSITALSLDGGKTYAEIIEEVPFNLVAVQGGPGVGSFQLTPTYNQDAPKAAVGPFQLNQAVVFGVNPVFGREDWKPTARPIPLAAGYIAIA